MTFHQHPTTYVSHLHLKVSNIEQSLDFYESVLGFKVLEQQPLRAELSANGESPLFTIEQPEQAIKLDPRNTGLFHVAFLLPKRSDLATILQHLIQMNYPLQGASDHLVSEAIYLSDPDGNGIEIYIDRDADQWNWDSDQVEMATKPLNTANLMKEVDQAGWSDMPKESIIGHIHLQVNELEKTKEFYTTGFGLDLVSRYGNQALFVSSSGYHHHIGLNTWNSAGGAVPQDTSVGMKSYSLSIPSNKRKQVAERLRNNQFEVSQDGDMYYVQDPSGNFVYF